MASRIFVEKLGDVFFSSFAAFNKALKEYVKDSYVVFVLSSSNRSANTFLRYKWMRNKCSRRPARQKESRGIQRSKTHVLTEDVVERRVLPGRKLYTKRLIIKQGLGKFPGWLRRFISGARELIVEESVMDMRSKRIDVITRNVGNLGKYATVIESCAYNPSPSVPGATLINRNVSIQSNLNAVLRSALVTFLVSRYRSSSKASFLGFEYVCKFYGKDSSQLTSNLSSRPKVSDVIKNAARSRSKEFAANTLPRVSPSNREAPSAVIITFLLLREPVRFHTAFPTALPENKHLSYPHKLRRNAHNTEHSCASRMYVPDRRIACWNKINVRNQIHQPRNWHRRPHASKLYTSNAVKASASCSLETNEKGKFERSVADRMLRIKTLKNFRSCENELSYRLLKTGFS
ncbi:PRELI domain-containing protein 1 mitochondrial, partial [Clonorchis sinensis]